jgi:hypothetical protein
MKFRVTAYEPRGENGMQRIAKHEVTIETKAQDGTILNSRTSKTQMRETVEGVDAAVGLMRKYRTDGFGVDVRDGSGRALDDFEFTSLLDLLIGSKPL